MSDARPNPDISLEVGYDVKTQKATFSIGLSNIFNRLGKKKFGFTVSRWVTRRKGRHDAKLGEPGSRETQPSGREREIWIERDARAERITGHVNEAVKATSEWIEKHSPQPLSTERIRKDIYTKLDDVFAYYDRRFEQRRGALADSLQTYQNFRTQHGLDRPAQVPLFFLRPIAVLLVAMLVETLANAALFAGISSQGLIGGWLTAVIVSVVNILMGLMLGLLVIRYGMAWDDWRRKALIGVGIVMGLAIVFFNLYVAHFREIAEQAVIADSFGDQTLTRERTPGFGDAWPHFIRNPFDLGSVLGVGLFVIGLVIAIFATYEGYKGFTDPFPGYGSRGKRFFINLLIRQRTEDGARAICTAVLDEARSHTDKSWGLHTHFKSEVFKAHAFLELLHKTAKQTETTVSTYAWQLVSDYRSANKDQRAVMARKARRTKKPDKHPDPGPPPEYFKVDTRTSGDWKSKVPSIEECQAQARRAMAIIDSNLKELEAVRDFIASQRVNAADVVAGRMDPADIRLRAEVQEATTRRAGLKVVSAAPARA